MFDLNYYYIVREEEGQDDDGKEIPPGKWRGGRAVQPAWSREEQFDVEAMKAVYCVVSECTYH